MFLLTIVLFSVFILNLVVYWLLFLKVKNKDQKIVRVFYKIFPVVWTLSLVPIPIINLSFLRVFFPNNYSYFKFYWVYFALLGVAFIIIGINFNYELIWSIIFI